MRSKWRSRIGTVAAAGLTAGGLAAFPGAGVASAQLPPQCEQSGKTVTCTYTDNSGEVRPPMGVGGVPLTIPGGVWRIHMEVVGGRGGDSCCGTAAPGGRAATVSGDAWLIPGSTVYMRIGENGRSGAPEDNVQVGGGGGSGGTTDWRRNVDPPNVNGGAGGGLSSVVLDTGIRNPLVGRQIEIPLAIAAGGGGGASTYAGTLSPGGDAGAPGAGARGGGTPAGYGDFGAGGGSDLFGGDNSSSDGLPGGPGYGGSAGSSGAAYPEAVGPGIGGGGGGGAGWYGGGGGAAGAQIGGIGDPNEPPGGGGGGLSLSPAGGVIGHAEPDSSPRIVVTFELP
ncbi:hypothetical protein G4H71_09725 [Rhodococcus triatomae]|uniref:Glycine rich protein n=1 Tax=Rhodococcus triatomae TaxID=300028 RepID=A0A1G8SPZ9_9NOCA|nr:hypothetical protein [Rhodococcus triatomae]QNG20810.1 hypothetical protein G4H72_20660 [Rhodococcus triatomae]QNG23275.1 hypothetical protein G4H71_09725 [Rhodococcus triatomae]SDJ31348.1 hypothetical protein SAMN05444695_12317 [Rhodococcus triatomae]